MGKQKKRGTKIRKHLQMHLEKPMNLGIKIY
jgi:hypothetical protein